MSDAQQTIELLRFNTCGSVDDGKSTLIGRLLYDSKSIMEDQMEALERSADITGGGQVNLANLTDGLRAEREQGITIDVAYRYVATPKRKFIVADTPGHVEYTRNMVTGASTANLSIVLVDARNGVIEQTRRHSYISALLGIPHIVFAVNKAPHWLCAHWNESKLLLERLRDGRCRWPHGVPGPLSKDVSRMLTDRRGMWCPRTHYVRPRGVCSVIETFVVCATLRRLPSVAQRLIIRFLDAQSLRDEFKKSA